MVNVTDLESSLTSMGVSMKVNGKMMNNTGMELRSGQTATNIRVSSRAARKMVKEPFTGMMAASSLEISKITI